MSDQSPMLALSTRAIVGSEQAVHLIEQKERLEIAASSGDAPLCLDMSKAFLESVFKTILSDRIESPNLEQNFGPLFKSVRDILLLNENANANTMLGNMASSIVHNVGELRNSFGAASHGDDGFHQTPIGMAHAEFVISAVDGLASLLYKRHRQTLEPANAQRLRYEDYLEFNDWLDGQFDGYSLPLGNGNVIEFTASLMIFDRDLNFYREMLIQYTSTEEDDEEDE